MIEINFKLLKMYDHFFLAKNVKRLACLTGWLVFVGG